MFNVENLWKRYCLVDLLHETKLIVDCGQWEFSGAPSHYLSGHYSMVPVHLELIMVKRYTRLSLPLAHFSFVHFNHKKLKKKVSGIFPGWPATSFGLEIAAGDKHLFMKYETVKFLRLSRPEVISSCFESNSFISLSFMLLLLGFTYSLYGVNWSP